MQEDHGEKMKIIDELKARINPACKKKLEEDKKLIEQLRDEQQQINSFISAMLKGEIIEEEFRKFLKNLFIAREKIKNDTNISYTLKDYYLEENQKTINWLCRKYVGIEGYILFNEELTND